MVLEWLKNALFGPKRREFLELQDFCYVMEGRIRRMEGNLGVYKREQAKEEDSAEMQAAMAEAAGMLKEGKSPTDVAKTILVSHPSVALKLAKQFGIKL
jgi:hypothetical protein